jgi:ssDNA-binding Zn-finger/Zn-ribbon topoisomerase 1
MTARTGDRGEIFLGCKNYLSCQHMKSLAVFRGVTVAAINTRRADWTE